ncbi:MAG: hydrogenase nickel incorporation protein HypA [Desulfurococcaceae archaeon]
MHEWAVAESIVLYLKNKGVTKARKVVVYLGILQNLDKDALLFAVSELAKNEGLILDSVEFADEEPLFRCNTCGYAWKLDTGSLSDDVREAVHFIPEVVHAYFKCPSCGSRDFEVVQGRGVSRIEVIPYD